jgi:hypothetical protein
VLDAVESGAYISLEFWGLVNETAMRTDAELTVQIDTPPGAIDTPEAISVTVELVVYMRRVSNGTNINGAAVMNRNHEPCLRALDKSRP